MTPDELKTVLDNAEKELEGVANLASAINPSLLPFILIGKAVAPLIPTAVVDVDRWIQGNPPTPEEKQQTHDVWVGLSNPDAP